LNFYYFWFIKEIKIFCRRINILIYRKHTRQKEAFMKKALAAVGLAIVIVLASGYVYAEQTAGWSITEQANA